MRLIAALFLLVPSLAYGSTYRVQNPDGDYVVLYEGQPCKSEKVKAMLRSEWLPHFLHAEMKWKGKLYEACWIKQKIQNQDVGIVIDEAGDQTPLPLKAMKKDTDI